MKQYIIIIIALFSSIYSMTAQQNDVIQLLDAKTFKDSITTKNVQLIDVRTPDEYNSGHIEDAKNIDFYSANFTAEFNKLDKEKPVYIYCKSGNRSHQSANKLVEMGFKHIYDLRGGILNYK